MEMGHHLENYMIRGMEPECGPVIWLGIRIHVRPPGPALAVARTCPGR